MAAEYCQLCRQELAALRNGENPAVSEQELRAHLASCESCRKAEDQAAAVSDLLNACQPPVVPGSFDRLSAAIAALSDQSLAPAKPSAWRGRVVSVWAAAAAAAAAFLVAAILGMSWSGRRQPASVATVTSAQDQAVSGARVLPGQTFSVAAGSRMALLTDRGAQIEVAGDSEIRVTASDEIVLVRGRLVASVRKGDTQFRVRTADAEVRTLGTRFAVEARRTPTRVTVIEGRVLFTGLTGAAGSVEVPAGQSSELAANGAPGSPQAARAEDLGRLLPMAAPSLDVNVAGLPTEIAPGKRLSARVEICNRSTAMVTVDASARPMPAFFLKLTDPSGHDSYACPSSVGVSIDGRPVAGAAIELKPESLCRVEMEFDALLEMPGEYRLAVICFGSARSDAGEWSGTVESRPVSVQVKAPAGRKSGGAGEIQGEPRR